MEIITNNDAAQASTSSNSQKQVYESPILHVYGAIHQFTQGTVGNNNDGQVQMRTMA